MKLLTKVFKSMYVNLKLKQLENITKNSDTNDFISDFY